MTEEDKTVEQEQEQTTEEQLDTSEEERLMAQLKEAIKVEKEEIGSLKLKLNITVPREVLDERLQDQFAELKRDAQVPGFRKGKAPMALIEKRFGTEVGNELVGNMMTSGYLAASQKEELNTLGDPLVWTTVKEERTDTEGITKAVETEKLLSIEEASEHIKMPKEGSLAFTCEVELRPEFDLPELKGIKLEKPDIGVKDEYVDQEIDRMRSIHGKFVSVADGAVEEDDMLFADVRVVVGDEEIVKEDNYDLPARDTRVKGLTVSGFGEVVKGKKVGDTVTAEITVPNDHESVALRGQTGAFSATLREIKRLEKAELTKEFLEGMGYDNESDLRDTIRSAMESQLDQMIREDYRRQIREFLLEKTTLDLPEGMPERLTEQTISRRKIEMLRGGASQDEADKKADEMRAQAREETIREMKSLFILEKIAEELDISVSEEEINGAIASFAARQNRRFDRVRDELSKSGGMWNLYLQLRDEKVFDQLIDEGDVEGAESPKKEEESSK